MRPQGRNRVYPIDRFVNAVLSGKPRRPIELGKIEKKKGKSEEFPFLLPEPWISKRISGRGEEDAADPVRPLGMWSHFVPEEIFDEKAFPVGRADWLMHPEQMFHAVLHFCKHILSIPLPADGRVDNR